MPRPRRSGHLAALAAQPGADEGDFLAVERAYFPWVNALNTMLDNLVDLDEDPLHQRHIERYGSPQAAAERLAAIAARSRAGVCMLPSAQQHELILAAMGGLYLHNLPPGLGIAELLPLRCWMRSGRSHPRHSPCTGCAKAGREPHCALAAVG